MKPLLNTIGLGPTQLDELRERFHRDPSPARLLRHVVATYPEVTPSELHSVLEDTFCLKISQSTALAGWWWESEPRPPLSDAQLDRLLIVEIDSTRHLWDQRYDTTARLALSHPDTHLLVLTGAGISAESGLSTYRAMNGLWREHPVQKVATPWGFDEDPALAWRFWSERREEASRAAPNPGHLALAEVERRLGDRFLLVTQNVDGLHQRAGNQRVVELHGTLHASRCTKCDRPPFQDAQLHPGSTPPTCERCPDRSAPGLIRPAVVWFGEPIAMPDMERVTRFMKRAAGHRFVFLAAGTSGIVTPASAFVEEARAIGAETWVVNLEPPQNAGYFDHVVLGASGEILPKLFASIDA